MFAKLFAEICRVEGITACESARRYVPDPHGGEDSPFAAKSGAQNAWKAISTAWPFIMLNHRQHQLGRRNKMKSLYFSILGYLYQVTISTTCYLCFKSFLHPACTLISHQVAAECGGSRAEFFDAIFNIITLCPRM